MIILKLRLKLLFIDSIFGKKHYIKKIVSLYKKTKNVIFDGMPKYIDKNARIDCFGNAKIYIGKGSVISAYSIILTHDYSIDCGLIAINSSNPDFESVIYKNVRIGENTFIGQRVIVLPGVSIGDNCIIGSGCVVSKNIPNNSIVVGNPCKIIKNTIEWAENKKNLNEFVLGDKRIHI